MPILPRRRPQPSTIAVIEREAIDDMSERTIATNILQIKTFCVYVARNEPFHYTLYK